MAFKVLIEILNSIISILNKYSLNLHDYENQEWYIKKVIYRNDEDKIYFKCEEEKVNG